MKKSFGWKKIILSVIVAGFVVGVCSNPSYSAFWNKNKNTNQQQIQNQAEQNQQQAKNQQTQEQQEATYPNDVDGQPIAEDEYIEDIDIEEQYRNMPVADFSYIHDIDPGEYQDTMNSTWSPYPLFRLTAPLYFKTTAIQPGYYLLTPREHEGKWYILFKEAGKVKYIVPCYKREMVPMNFYKNHLPQIKLTKAQLVREKTLKFIGKHIDSSKRKPIKDTYLEATDMDNSFISIIVYWGNYRYYFVVRSIQL